MIGAALGAAGLVLGQVALRGLEDAPAGKVTAVSASGVTLDSGTVIPWDRVRSVEGELAGESAAFLPLGETAWRARTRLQRGDFVGAEPLFEEAFRQTRSEPGATAAVVAEGLLRCRLRRGAHVLAAEAWIALLRAQGAAASTSPANWAGAAGLAPVIDPSTRLAAALPPIWCGPGAAQAMAGLPGFSSGTGQDAPTLHAALYAAAARHEAGELALLPQGNAGDPGVALVRLIVVARAGDAEQRRTARTALEARLPPPTRSGEGAVAAIPGWMEAWVRVGIGRSLLVEETREERLHGVLALLEVPARIPEAHPYLTGVALAEAAVALGDLGDGAGASTLARELASRYPTHPALEWPPIRALQHTPRSPASPKT